eukprot:TRINITY_DN3143_c0_g1_i4.p1 TRINITY_DN3143_c0_g1~~TRINITY_DN3143_c0_g1_i4.p1  ORF type:complete len:198 (-),score=32.32 TRINITY_DN3143_c0_g1_i4:88-609(-)
MARILAAILALWSVVGQDMFLVKSSDPVPPTLTYWHSYVAADGLVYFAECNYRNFSEKSIGPGIEPLWLESLPLGDGVNATVTQFPVGHVAPWHVDPYVQLIHVLQGRIGIELSGGESKTFVPGQLYLEEDHLAENVTGKFGHVTSNVGDGVAIFLVLQTQLKPQREQPCRFV